MENLAIFCLIFGFLGSHLIAGKSVGKSVNLKEILISKDGLVEALDTKVPDTKMPDVNATNVPDTKVPDTRTPDVTPDTKTPDIKVPDTQVPDTETHDVVAPDTPYQQMSEERTMPWISEGSTAMPWYETRTTMAWNEEPITNSLTTESSRTPQTTEASTPVSKDEDTQTLQPTDHKSVTAAPQYFSELKVNLNLGLAFQSKSIH